MPCTAGAEQENQFSVFKYVPNKGQEDVPGEKEYAILSFGFASCWQLLKNI